MDVRLAELEVTINALENANKSTRDTNPDGTQRDQRGGVQEYGEASGTPLMDYRKEMYDGSDRAWDYDADHERVFPRPHYFKNHYSISIVDLERQLRERGDMSESQIVDQIAKPYHAEGEFRSNKHFYRSQKPPVLAAEAATADTVTWDQEVFERSAEKATVAELRAEKAATTRPPMSPDEEAMLRESADVHAGRVATLHRGQPRGYVHVHVDKKPGKKASKRIKAAEHKWAGWPAEKLRSGKDLWQTIKEKGMQREILEKFSSYKNPGELEEHEEETYSRLDRDHNGRVTRAELIIRLRKDDELRELLHLPKKIGDGERELFEAVFQGIDANDDRSVSVEEFVQYLGRMQAGEIDLPEVLSVSAQADGQTDTESGQFSFRLRERRQTAAEDRRYEK